MWINFYNKYFRSYHTIVSREKDVLPTYYIHPKKYLQLRNGIRYRSLNGLVGQLINWAFWTKIMSLIWFFFIFSFFFLNSFSIFSVLHIKPSWKKVTILWKFNLLFLILILNYAKIYLNNKNNYFEDQTENMQINDIHWPVCPTLRSIQLRCLGDCFTLPNAITEGIFKDILRLILESIWLEK